MHATYDADPIGALAVALRIVLESPSAAWDELIAVAPIDEHRAQRLRAGETVALDELYAELNELRTLE